MIKKGNEKVASFDKVINIIIVVGLLLGLVMGTYVTLEMKSEKVISEESIAFNSIEFKELKSNYLDKMDKVVEIETDDSVNIYSFENDKKRKVKVYDSLENELVIKEMKNGKIIYEFYLSDFYMVSEKFVDTFNETLYKNVMEGVKQ